MLFIFFLQIYHTFACLKVRKIFNLAHLFNTSNQTFQGILDECADQSFMYGWDSVYVIFCDNLQGQNVLLNLVLIFYKSNQDIL